LFWRWFCSWWQGSRLPGALKVSFGFTTRLRGNSLPLQTQASPPIETTSGPGTGVRAWVFSCGDCANPDERFIGYLEKMHPNTKKFMDEEIAKTGASMGIGQLIDKYSSGILVRSPNKKNWVPRISPAGQAIIGNSLKTGDCSNPIPCLP